jgi:hypothetical protein
MPPPKLTSKDTKELHQHADDLEFIAAKIREDAVAGADARIFIMTVRVLIILTAKIADVALAHGMAGLGIEMSGPKLGAPAKKRPEAS